jgi:L-seryl-tRNA(Ser) seleniumtransferase
LLDTADFGLGHEPTVQESVQSGAALVTFSGDKLLGGPQAGIIVGERPLVEKLRKHPLARAVRADKTTLAGLHATLLHYARQEALQQVPVWHMIAMAASDIRQRAERWAADLGRGVVIEARSTVGGGSLPEETLPSWALGLETAHPARLAAAFRQSTPPVIGRIDDDRLLLDPRTVLPEQDEILMSTLRLVLAPGRASS